MGSQEPGSCRTSSTPVAVSPRTMIAPTATGTASLPSLRVASSIWQSIGLLIRRFGVQVPGDPPEAPARRGLRHVAFATHATMPAATGHAGVAELADAPDLGSGIERCGSSSLPTRTAINCASAAPPRRREHLDGADPRLRMVHNRLRISGPCEHLVEFDVVCGVRPRIVNVFRR